MNLLQKRRALFEELDEHHWKQAKCFGWGFIVSNKAPKASYEVAETCKRFAQINTILGERAEQDSDKIPSSEHITR